MLHNNNHADLARLTDFIDTVDGSFCAATSGFDDPSGTGVEIEVACWVN
jgi:hypothetical protein